MSIKTEIISSETLYKGSTKSIEINKFYDFHGESIDEGQDTLTFDKPVDFEIKKEMVRWHFEYGDPTDFENWTLFINGKEKKLQVEIVGYKVLKNRLILSGCVGAG